jgi:hypothetical protein
VVRFWKLWVRTPAALGAAGAFALGAYGAVDWGLALTTACLGACIAKAASSIARRRAEQAEEGAQPASIVDLNAHRGRYYDRAA